MHPAPLSRRAFLTTAAATALLPIAGRAADRKTPGVRWPIGCFNRPWTKWSYDEALNGIKSAGYTLTGLLSASRDNPLTGTAATPEYLASLKKQIAERGLKANMYALRVNNAQPLDRAIADARKQIENAHTLGLEYALTFGEGRAERYAQFNKVMADVAAFAEERRIKLVMKPHGGGSGSSVEILDTIKAVGHRNFKIWYDAGNIIFYTGKDPVTDIEPIVEHVTGFCAKDCGAQRGEVMIQFGTGKVDFAGVFRKMKAAGFNGPIMVESCKVGATPEETTANARANREYLEQVLATL